MSKLDLNDNGSILYVAGNGGSRRYDRQSEDVFALAAKKDAPRVVQIKSSKYEPYPLLAQVAAENSMMCLDKVLVPTAMIEEGIREKEDGNFFVT